MSVMTDHCYDLLGPKDQLVVATSDGWIPFDERAATRLAESAMMLAFGPEHVERLRQESQAPASSASPPEPPAQLTAGAPDAGQIARTRSAPARHE